MNKAYLPYIHNSILQLIFVKQSTYEEQILPNDETKLIKQYKSKLLRSQNHYEMWIAIQSIFISLQS